MRGRALGAPASLLRPALRLALILIGLSVVAGELPVAAQRFDIVFDRIESEDSPYVVYTSLQDRDGFMWFGTQNGLYRYDGHRFVLSEPDSKAYGGELAVYSLLEVVEENGESFLWIGTQRGFGRWNRQTLEYDHFPADAETGESEDSTDRTGAEVRALFQDRAGDLWIGRMNGLLRLSNGDSTEFHHDPTDPTSISSDEIRSLAEDAEGNLWIATARDGLNRLGPSREGPFTQYRHDPDDPTSLSDDNTRVVYVDDDDRVWVGTYKGGLNRLDESRTSFERFEDGALESSRVRSLFQDRDGDFWAGTDDGLFLFDPAHRRFSRYESSSKPRSISDNRVNSIYQDDSGIIWLGTQWRISKLDRLNPGVFELTFTEGDKEGQPGLSANTIQAFAEAADGTLWIGTYRGLNRLDPKTREFTQFLSDPNDPSSLGNNKVGSLLMDRQGILWVGTYEDGLNRFDPETGVFTKIPTEMPKVPCIYEDRQGVLWVATFDGGVMTIDLQTGARASYRHDPAREHSLSSDKVISIFEDAEGTMWFGTHNAGLNSFDRRTGRFTRYVSDDEDQEALSANGIFSISEYEGSLQIGTFNGGLNVWSRENREANPEKPVFTRADLAPRSIYGLLVEPKVPPGEKPHLWASTDRGLWRRSPVTGTWKLWGDAQDFNFGAYLALQSGSLYFGSDAGMLKVSPYKIRPNPYKAPIVLTDLLIRNQSQKFDRPLHLIQEFDLDYRDTVVTFEFAQLDYSKPGTTRYEYRIGERKDEWVDIGTSHRATFTNLPAGHHSLSVRTQDRDGVSSAEVLLASIHVTPHPLQSNLAYAVYGLILIGAVAWFLHWQGAKREQLERVVSERTAALASQNRALEELNQKFEEASYTDSLTGLRNRRYLLGTIEKDLDLVLRHYTDRERDGIHGVTEVRPDFLFLLIDLDGFKEVNDTYGHTAGDRVLEQVCGLMEHACRTSDTLIRWGGDEFLIVGRYTERAAAEELADRIREAICEHPFDIGTGRPIRLTSSIGFSCYPFVPSKPNLLNWEQIIGIADQALYLVKEAGRNSWAGVFSTEKSHLAPGAFFTTEIHERFEQLEREAYIDVRRPRMKRRAAAEVTA